MNEPATILETATDIVLGSFTFDPARYPIAASLMSAIALILRRTH